VATAKDHLILFCDLIGSTEVAAEQSPSFYAESYVASFHWAARQAHAFIKRGELFGEACFAKTIDRIKITGDECLSFTPLCEKQTEMEDLAASAVSFAYVTKLFWLASPYNLLRMMGKQFPRDLAVGIHIGPVARVPAPAGSPVAVASLHINVAKRIEGKARDGKESRIFASKDVADLFGRWRERVKAFEEAKRPPLCIALFSHLQEPFVVDGLPKKLQLYELKQKDTDPVALVGLLNHLAKTPNVDDVAAETAARGMAETLLGICDLPFVYAPNQAPLVVNPIPDCATPAKYIEIWFKAMESQPKLFLDEAWLVLNCYLMSCALLRHPKANKTARSAYETEAKKIHANLLELLKPKED